MPHPNPDFMSHLCQLDRHAFCPRTADECDCYCHLNMTPEYAAALILRLAGERLWPDEQDTRQALVDRATNADPFHPELARARRLLGLA